MNTDDEPGSSSYDDGRQVVAVMEEEAGDFEDGAASASSNQAPRPAWKCEMDEGPDGAPKQCLRFERAKDGSQDLVLGHFTLLQATLRSRRSKCKIEDNAPGVDTACYLRLRKDEEERYCALSVYVEDEEFASWNELHTGTLEGWGRARARKRPAGSISGVSQTRLDEETLLSLYNLVQQQVVQLPVVAGSIDFFERVRVSVVLKAVAITQGAVPVSELEGAGIRRHTKDLRNVLAWLHPTFVDVGLQEPRFDLQQLYAAMKHPLTNEPAAPHPDLRPTLRPYQLRAARWMQCREDDACAGRALRLHPLQRPLTCECGTQLYYSEWSGHVATAPTLHSDNVRGGVLCDEMGLGKTVELLHLILSRPRPSNTQPPLSLQHSAPGKPFVGKVGGGEEGQGRARRQVAAVRVTNADRAVVDEGVIQAVLGPGGEQAWSEADGKHASDGCSKQALPACNSSPLDSCHACMSEEEVVGTLAVEGEGTIGEEGRRGERGAQGQQGGEGGVGQAKPVAQTVQEMGQEHGCVSECGRGGGEGEWLVEGAQVEVWCEDYPPPSTDHPDWYKAYIVRIFGAEDKVLVGFYVGDATSPSAQDETALISVANGRDFIQPPRGWGAGWERGRGDGGASVGGRAVEGQSGGWGERKRKRSEESGDVEVDRERLRCDAQGLYGDCAGPYWMVDECVKETGWEVIDEDQLIPVRATLIVSPTHILDQWEAEIKRHTKPGSVRVVCYAGIKGVASRDARESRGVGEGQTPVEVLMAALADADIVLTTYEVLRGDVHHDGTPGRALRREKRYKVVASPLLRVHWWRVCLDEAQMVECTTAKAAEMALKLATQNRWCVTGTPVHRGLEDLQGLALFLGCAPWSDRTCWTRALLRPYLRGAAGAVSRAHAWVSEVFWRTQKGDVAHEISLPPQTEVTKRLHFAPVEAHFYRRQHDECAEAVRRVLSDLRRRKQTAMDDRMSVRVLQQMQKLRQACCHPQVGGSGVHSIHKKVLTMEEILTQLLERVKNECEEATRLVVAAEHGLAAVSILQAEDKAVAMQHYRNVLELEHKGQADGIRVDLLPRMHSRHNLAAVMREAECASVEVCGRQMSVEELATEEARIRNEFSAAQNTNVSACIERLGAAEDEVLRALGSRGEAGRMWYLEALELLASGGQAETVLDRVDHALSEGHKYSHATKQRREQDERSMAGKFTSVAGLKFLLNKRMDDLWEKRKQLLAQLRRLSAVPTQGEIDECGNCGDCKANYLKTGRRCRMCRLADEINAYKCAVFHHNAERDDKQSREYQERVGAGMLDGDRSGTKISLADGTAERKKSELESSLRVILGLLKRSGAGGAAGSSSAVSGDRARVLEQGRQQLEVWEKLGREYDRAQVLWRSQRERLEKLDELSMANMRMRYRNEDEEINEHTQFLLLEQGLEAEKRQALEFDRQDAKGRMLKARGQLKYLANLVQAQAARKRLAAAAAAEARRGAAGAGLAAGGGQGGGGEAAAETGVQGGAVGMDVDGDLGTCPVCTDEVGTSSEGVMLPCGHLLCYQCCRDLLKRSGGRHTKCPTCRNPCNNSELTYVYGDRIGDDCGKGQGKEGGEAIGGGGSSKEGLKEEQDVKGSYSTKIVAVVQGLKRLPDGEKAIVFSEWEDMLELLSHALHANGIRHVRCKGTKAISKGLSLFKQDPEVRAVLLPFKSGSNGLNVIEATHVFLIEPLLNVAVEAQAIGRVHRIGQDKPTTVHRMIVEQTVEERVHELSVKKMRALQHDGGISLEHARAAATKKETVTLEDMEALFDASSTASTDAYNDSWWAQRVQWGHGSGAEGAEGAEGASVRDRGLGADGELPVGPVIQRREALDRLLRAEAAERRQAVGGIESQEPGGMEVLYGQSVTLSVAERLRALPPVEEDMSGGKVEGGKG